jgi:hypothetical protein
MGAVAFQKGLGAIHALSHPVGAVYNTHHGTTNAVVMPAVLRFNRPAVEDRLAAAAAYLGIAGGFDGFAARVDELNALFGIPKGLGAMGVEEGAVSAARRPVPHRHGARRPERGRKPGHDDKGPGEWTEARRRLHWGISNASWPPTGCPSRAPSRFRAAGCSATIWMRCARRSG